MSGAEAIVVLGVISSIISIIDGTKQIYDAATNVQGLPEAFRDVAGRLPIIRNILDSSKQHIDKGDVDEDSCKGVKRVVDACEEKAKKLDKLFHKAIPADGASDLKRYYKAVKAYGKGNEVENLMKGMLEDVQLLACEHGMKTATKAQQEQIAQAISAMSAIPSSVPEHEFQETGFTANNSGSGTQYNAQGENIAQGNARQYNIASGTMNFEYKSVYGTENAVNFHGDSNNVLQIGDNSGTIIYNTRDTGLDEAECLAALFLTDPRDDRETLVHVKGSRVDGTCEWIKTNALYDSWLHSHSQLLWLSGGPGKGKTMLSIYLAEQLERSANDSQNEFFLQYFCDNKDEKRNTAVALIRGLIYQLVQRRPKLVSYFLPSFKIQKESLFTASSFETLWRIFEAMIRDPVLGSIYCVIDGLDECDEASLALILNKIKSLFSTKSSEISACHLKLIVVSREYPKFIPDLLSSFPRIRMDPDTDREVNDDILRFIDVKVNELSRSTSQPYPESLRLHVKDVFQDRAQGTFLWIGLVSIALKKYEVTEIEKALDLLPPGLDGLYSRLLLQIDVDRREIAAKILRWVVMAVRPLTLSELSVATEIATKPSLVAFSRNEVIRDQVSRCGYFLTIKRRKKGKEFNYEDEEVGLIHQSAKDYLLRATPEVDPVLEAFRVKREAGNLEISRKCLGYLQDGAFAGGEVNFRKDIAHLKAFPLLSYATLHWPDHARSLARSEDIFNLSLPFYQKKCQSRISWLKTYWAIKEYGNLTESFTLLHLSSYFGILPLAENLLLKKGLVNKVKRLLYINKVDDKKRTALIWAALNGHETMVRLLLEKGADVEAKDSYRMTALIYAAQSRYEAIVQLLLEKGADVEAKSNSGKTALIYAAQNGHEAIVRRLLEKGADVEAKDGNGWTALIYAAQDGHEAVMHILLEKGADVEAKDSDGMTVLVWAAQDGDEDMVQLLLEKGADFEAKDSVGTTALIHAAQHSNEAMVRLLLDKGVDVEVKDRLGKTALIWAAWNGDEAIVQLLLEKGADIEVMDSDGKTALIWAVWDRQEAMVQLLLDKEADIEATDSNGKTALIWAAHRGYKTITQLLLERRADIEAKDSNGWTALIWAAHEGHKAITQLLLERGADVEAKDSDGKTALIWAAQDGHEAVVQLLSPLNLNL